MPCFKLLNHLGDGKHYTVLIHLVHLLLNHLGDGKLTSVSSLLDCVLLNHLGDGKQILSG